MSCMYKVFASVYTPHYQFLSGVMEIAPCWTLLESRSKIGSDASFATTIDFPGIRARNTLHRNHVYSAFVHCIVQTNVQV